MKKTLLILSLLITSLSAVWAAEGQLNAYAYGASFVYAPETQTIAFNWSLPSEASALRIVAIDAAENKYVLKEYGVTSAGAYHAEMSIWDAVDADRLPLGEDLKLAIEVKTADRSKHEVVSSNKYIMQSPFSIDVDNNPSSKYFGLKYVTQMDGSSGLKRGVYVFDQTNSKVRDAQIDSDITLLSSWWDATHGIPHMVRAIPDGSGRLLITSSDRDQDTYMWLAEPSGNGSVPTYTTWKTVITNAQMVSWTGLSGARFANVSFDIRSNGDNWDIILYTANAKGNADFFASEIYSGVYSVPKSNAGLTGGTYTTYTYESGGIINQDYTRSMLNASANFDKFGGVLYNAHSDDYSPQSPALKHRTLNGDFKDDYADGDLLKRTYVATKGVRFSPDFKKIAIAQNAAKTNGTEVRIYDVAQTDGNSHISLSNGVSVDVVTGSSVKAFVHDIAWDYGQNVYITVRNQTTKVDSKYIHGIYAVATDLNEVPVSTPLYTSSGEEYFNIGCTDGQYTVSLGQTGGTGTLTGAGTYDACSKVTVTVTPDNQYKFIRWTEGGVEVSKEKSYSFYLTRNRELTAEFEPAVYNNITWWNLFQNGEDITDFDENISTEEDDKVNMRLWRLFQVEYNAQYGSKHTDAGTVTQGGRPLQKVFYYVNFLYDGDGNDKQVLRDRIEDILDNDNEPKSFYWLGQYIENVVDASVHNGDINAYNGYNIWGFYLQAFINRTSHCWNQAIDDSFTEGQVLNSTSSSANQYKAKSFLEAGKPTNWRPFWTEKVCDLPQTMTYNDAMPIEWRRNNCSSGSITVGGVKINPKEDWYKWNTADAPQNGGNEFTHILAWRKGSATGEIKTCVDEDNLQLFATYVRKNIHENDPAEDLSQDPCDATNSDIFKLLYNKTWDAPWHKISITRKLQGGMFNTICLPFSVDLARDIPANSPLKKENAEFWEYEGTTSSYNQTGEDVTILNFTKVSSTGALRAGVPYLVKVDNDITDEYLYFGGELSHDGISVLCDTVPKVVSAQEGNPIPISFVGVINPEKNLPAGSLILVADSRLAITTETGRMEGMRGYFRIDPMWAADIAEQAADGRVYLSMKKPVTTSIPVAPEAEQQTKPEVRKIMRDGQIYILRGDEVYTITGHRVR